MVGIDVGAIQAPHCDQAVLHAPGECRYCDSHPMWQGLRQLWGIAFTGHDPVPVYEGGPMQLPCPSDAARGRGGAHAWAGNRPTDIDPGPPGPNPRAGFGPTGREPQRSFPVPARRFWQFWRRTR